MTGIQEVPGPGDPDGNGTVEIRVDPGDGQVCWNLYARGIEPATAAHIHRGAAGIAGPPVVTLTTPDAAGRSQGCADGRPGAGPRDGDARPRFLRQRPHRRRIPAGAIRGQLRGGPIGAARAASGRAEPAATRLRPAWPRGLAAGLAARAFAAWRPGSRLRLRARGWRRRPPRSLRRLAQRLPRSPRGSGARLRPRRRGATSPSSSPSRPSLRTSWRRLPLRPRSRRPRSITPRRRSPGRRGRDRARPANRPA